MVDQLGIPCVATPEAIQDFSGSPHPNCGQVNPIALGSGNVALGVFLTTSHALLLFPRSLVVDGQDLYDVLLGTPFEHLTGSMGIDCVHSRVTLRPFYWSYGDPRGVYTLPLLRQPAPGHGHWGAIVRRLERVLFWD
jgi:hypothetical protein